MNVQNVLSVAHQNYFAWRISKKKERLDQKEIFKALSIKPRLRAETKH